MRTWRQRPLSILGLTMLFASACIQSCEASDKLRSEQDITGPVTKHAKHHEKHLLRIHNLEEGEVQTSPSDSSATASHNPIREFGGVDVMESFFGDDEFFDSRFLSDLSLSLSFPTSSLRCGMDPLAVKDGFFDMLIKHSPASVLSIPDSPQGRALDWLSLVDGRELCPYQDDEDAIVQRYAMAVIYYALDGPTWNECSAELGESEHEWMTPKHECEWRFVHEVNAIGCDNELHVTEIPLQTGSKDCENTGSIPPEIQLLEKLEVLDLWQNNVGGGLVKEIGSLVNLKTLILGGNQFEGKLPPEWAALNKLEVLDLNDNKLIGEIPPEWGRGMESLIYFMASGNEIDGGIPTTFQDLDKLQSLDLSYNQLNLDIPTEMGDMDQLEYVTLYCNLIDGSVPTELCKKEPVSPLVKVDCTVACYEPCCPINDCTLQEDCVP